MISNVSKYNILSYFHSHVNQRISQSSEKTARKSHRNKEVTQTVGKGRFAH